MHRFLLLATLLLAAPAIAADFTEVLLDDDGCPLRNDFTIARTSATIAKADCPRTDRDAPLWRPDLTLGDLVYYSLMVTITAESPQPSGDEKWNRAELAAKVRREKNIELQPQEIILVKKVVGLIWPPSTVGLVYPRVDPSLRRK